ncbi:MAG: hypothetical protein IPQ27_10290 [Chitinophagaceae bacterium]|nr:hypothetical protein [Chitinophagaceae bacterium]
MQAKSIRGQTPEEIKSARESYKQRLQTHAGFCFHYQPGGNIDTVSTILDATGISIFGVSTARKI